VKYAFVEKNRRQYGVPALCEALQVSRSGYYAARHRGPSERHKRRVDLTARGTGTATNYGFSVSPLQSQTVDFYATPSGSTFTGGRDSSSSPDTGSVTVSINGTPYKVNYDGTDSATTVAQHLASAISGGTLANASASGGTITITAKTTGPGGNYSFTTSYTYDTAHFSHPSFTPSPFGGALSGGYNFVSEQLKDALLAAAPNCLTFRKARIETELPSDQGDA